MANQNVCGFFKFGYCKYEEKCRKMHVNGECELVSCEIFDCIKRHPIVCRYLRDFSYCKFGAYYKFSNTNLQKTVNEDSDKKFETMEKSMIEKDTVIVDLVEKVNVIEKSLILLEKEEQESIKRIEVLLSEKIEVLQNTVLTMKKCLIEKDEYIENFESRLSKLEENKIVENVPTTKGISLMTSLDLMLKLLNVQNVNLEQIQRKD